jgi:iron complex outermembrane recepter protein
MTRKSEVAPATYFAPVTGAAAEAIHLATQVTERAPPTTAPRSSRTSAASGTRTREMTVTERTMNRLKSRLGRHVSWAVTLVIAGTAPVFAQVQTNTNSDQPVLQEVVVTGSRIASPNATASSPIQVVSSADIQATGRNDISDVLNQLPQILSNDLGQDLGNRTPGLSTAGGVATADLRGIGPNRTLVLVDGMRLGQGSPQTTIASPAPDLDQIPLVMVERVEVLTGGASSVYGSDAIAGVVNFIMRKNFQGLEVSGQYGQDEHDNRNKYMDSLLTSSGYTPLKGSTWDGQNRTINMVMGTNFADNTGNVTAYFTYLNTDPVASSARDFGQCQLTEVQDPTSGIVTGNTCLGSTNANRFTPLTGPNANTRYAVVGNAFVPWSASLAANPPTVYNSQPFIYMQRQDTRYMAGFNAHEDLEDWAKPYMDFGFMNDKTHQAIAPSAAFTTSNPNTGGPYFVNCGNPFLSAQQVGILGCTPAQIAGNQANQANQVPIQIGRRNVEGGGRSSDYEHTNFRAAVGMKGDFLEAWSYDAYGQYYYTTFDNQNNNYLSYNKIDNALLVTGTAANAHCVSGSPCVPWNIFSDGGVTPSALNYLYLLGTSSGNNTLRTIHGDVTGKLGKYGIQSPLAQEGVGVNFGYEHRNENVQFSPDDATNSGQLSGAGGTQEPLHAAVGVNEEFIEFRLPVAQELPFAKDLVLGTGFRHSNYSVSGGVNTYKFDVQWAPIEDVRLRASLQRAIRAPSVSELFNQANIGLIQFGNDPCAAPATATLQQCLNTVSAANAAAFAKAYGNGTTTNIIPQAISGQLAQLQGGNQKLQPEKSRSVSLGFLFSPTAVPNLTGSIDYWQIHLDGEITTYPASVLVTNCLQTGNPVYCSGVVRTTTDYSLQGATVATGGYIVQTNQNIASLLQSGIDLQANYKLALPGAVGTLQWSLNGSYLLHASTRPLPGGNSYDCAGLFGLTCQTIDSRWRHNLRTTYLSPWDADLSLTWRFIGKVGNDNNDPNPLLAGNAYGAYDQNLRQLPNVSYIDMAASWHALKGIDIRAGVNNLFDRQPPLVPLTLQPGGAANTYGTYDVLGRQLYVAFTAKF